MEVVEINEARNHVPTFGQWKLNKVGKDRFRTIVGCSLSEFHEAEGKCYHGQVSGYLAKGLAFLLGWELIFVFGGVCRDRAVDRV